jgi:hypothetical protein
MKKIFNKFINGLMAWAEILAEYRQSKSFRYYY